MFIDTDNIRKYKANNAIRPKISSSALNRPNMLLSITMLLSNAPEILHYALITLHNAT